MATEPTGTATVTRANKFLAPRGGTAFQAYNVWAGTFDFDPECTSTLAFDPGNWVTMANPGVYEAIFIWRGLRSPEWTMLVPTLSESVGKSRAGPEAEPFDLPFVIDSDGPMVGREEIFGDPGALEEGQWASLQGRMFAARGPEFYVDS